VARPSGEPGGRVAVGFWDRNFLTIHSRIDGVAAGLQLITDLLTRREGGDEHRVVSHLTVAQDEDVARVLARHPDLRKHLPTLG
jgi:hypothetical protein